MSEDRSAALLEHVKVLMRVMLVSERTGPEHQHAVRYNALDFHALHVLRVGQTLRASHLVDDLGVAPTTASSAIARLVRQGLIERRQNAEDRRAYDLSLTKKGLDLANTIYAQDIANMTTFLSALTEDEQTQLLDAFAKISARVAALEG
ncbi:MAG: MarR family transcriptional regulator [Pseudomonadota bacterium]